MSARPRLCVAVLARDRLDLHADSGNAEVLAARAGWEGIDVTVVDAGDRAPEEVDIWLAGDGDDTTLAPAIDALRPHTEALEDSVDRGAAVLAVGLGLHLLASAHETADGEWHAGIGVFPGQAPLLPRRVSGELVAHSPWGTMVGYENHARAYRPGADERAWGPVLTGVGNGDRTEGVELGGLIGTHLHGPVLAQNPALADALLTRAMQRRYQAPYAAGSAEARHVDELIAAIRRRATGSRGSA